MSDDSICTTLRRSLRHAIVAAIAACAAVAAHAAVPGITGPSFFLQAAEGRSSQPDGASVYSWGYGCNPAGTTAPGFAPAGIAGANCPTMQLPGPTLIVNQGDTVTVVLANKLPAAAGNTSILFPGFTVTTTGGVPGILTTEASQTTPVTYTFVADTPGTHSYYSGTQADLQIEMGLYGAVVVLPTRGTARAAAVPAGCRAVSAALASGQADFRLAAAAYDHPATCYDREYLFQFSEMDPRIHNDAEAQATLPCAIPAGCMLVDTEPYHPAYFLINGRSMPDLMDPHFAPQYQHQPYNGNPHMHPGELVLLRVIGTGRWQHPFHEHGNHVRVLARDGNMLLTTASATSNLAGPLLFTTTTTPGVAMDGIFQWTGKGLNWDVYAHAGSGGGAVYNVDPPFFPAGSPATFINQPVKCVADTNGYYTTASGAPPNAPNYYEWCADHNHALETHPFGDVGSGGPATLPDTNILTNGTWFGGSAYLGPDATGRAVGPTGSTPPSGTIANPPGSESGYAYMWHSHNEREITTNNIFPGGMMMMMLVDPPVFPINESN